MTDSPSPSPNPALPFPSLAWFERLAALMEKQRARHEHLGYVDCVAGFRVLAAGEGDRPWTAEVSFEEFSVTGVRKVESATEERADFVLEAPLAVWRAMIDSIAGGGGRPGLDYTLNRMTHMSDPMRLVGDDPLRVDLYFRYNQSLQEFINASAEFATRFSVAESGKALRGAS